MSDFTCPRCGAVSHHPMDIREGYCGRCHDWTGKPSAGNEARERRPGDELYAWQVLQDGEWGVIAAGLHPDLSDQTQLVSRSVQVAHLMGLAAVAHHDTTGLPVRLVRLAVAEVMREIP